MKSEASNAIGRIHPLTLRFEPQLESAFRAYDAETSRVHMRWAVIAGALIYLTFGVLDAWMFPSVRAELLTVRYVLVAPFTLLCIVASCLQRLQRYMQWIVTCGVLACGLGTMAVITLAPPPGNALYCGGLALVLIYNFAASRLRFMAATTNAWVLVGVYIAMELEWAPNPPFIVVANSFCLISSNIIGMFGAYFLEYNLRRSFLSYHLLEREKVKAEIINARLQQEAGERERIERQLREYQNTLEDRVTARTGELASSNDRLTREILQREQIELDLQRAKAAAESANFAKSQFLANMSHELRTPMTAILGFAELLGDPEVDTQDRDEAVDTIRRNGEYLLGIINDILDLSKIEAGRLDVERIECSPLDLVRDVARLVRVRADAKGLPLLLECGDHIPAAVWSDPTRLRQVLVNLVGNAVKFTEHGYVRLAVSASTESDRARMVFDVIDTGIGMTPQQLNRLFQPFAQADSSTTRRFGGTGLGLAISRRLAEVLGGDIEIVRSAPARGTHVRLTVNAEIAPAVREPETPMASRFIAETTAPSAEEKPTSKSRGGRVLLAEDGPDNQRLISHVLRKAGAQVEIAQNGREAVEAVLAARDGDEPFDMVFMDMQMPVMDGYEATQRLREAGFDGPIVALTAHAMTQDRQKCLSAGCTDYAAKPIERKSLVQLLNTYGNMPRESSVH